MDQIVKSFSHLARDIQIYCFSGLIVLLNLAFLHQDPWQLFCVVVHSLTGWVFLLLLLISYIGGHITFAIMYFFFERRRIEENIKKSLKFGNKEDENEKIRKEVTVFKSDKGIYDQFIERHNTLNLMTWNFSGAFLLSSIIALCSFKWRPALIFLGLWNILYILALKREKDMNDRRDVCFEDFMNNIRS